MAIPPGLLGYVDFLSPQEQEGIREHLLGKPPERLFNGESSNELSLRAYFSYYTEQIARALDDKRVSASIKAHQDVFDIVDHLDTSMTRDEVQQKVRCPPSSICDVEIQKSTVDFVARLLLLVNFGDMHCVQLSRRRGLQWETNCLSGYLKAHFCQPIRLGEQRVSLGKSFTARNLHRIGGFGIILTNNLADHLRLTEDDKAVEIFHHASFLEHHRERSLFPDQLVGETLRTLSLLFPQADRETEKWFQKIRMSQKVVADDRILRCGRLHADNRQIENFKFWHDRLVMLKQAYDEVRPSTIKQLWYDRRNGGHWYTFWVAVLIFVLTIFFGLVQSIEGALQVYKAYHP